MLTYYLCFFVYFRFGHRTHAPSTRYRIPFILAVLSFDLMFNLKCPWPPKNFNRLHNSTIFTRGNTETIDKSETEEPVDALRDITNVDITVEKNRNFTCYFSNSRQLLTLT